MKNGFLILVADDDDELREMVVHVLIRTGYAVVQAESVPAALQLLAKMPKLPDLLVTDYCMPGNGVVLAKMFDNAKIPVIMHTGDPTDARKEMDQNGMDHLPIIAKPYDFIDLIDAIKANLPERYNRSDDWEAVQNQVPRKVRP